MLNAINIYHFWESYKNNKCAWGWFNKKFFYWFVKLILDIINGIISVKCKIKIYIFYIERFL